MHRIDDLTGRRFGHLVVLSKTDKYKNGYVVWNCLCDCGRTVDVSSRYLKNGWTTSCGCIKRQKEYKDLTGRRFGMLTVSEALPREYDANGHLKPRLWHCICDCGGTVDAPSTQLLAGYRKSCGCLSAVQYDKYMGKRFGSLTVVDYDGRRDGRHYWKCVCECGNTVSVCQSNLKCGHTTSCGCKADPRKLRHFVDGTCIETIASSSIARNNTSGVRGVYKVKKTGMWAAQITFRGKTIYLGRFNTLREAKECRQKAEEELFHPVIEAFKKKEKD